MSKINHRFFELNKWIRQQHAPGLSITQSSIERGRPVSMTNQTAAEHDVDQVWTLGRTIGKVRTAGDDLWRRRLAGARVNPEDHRVIVPVLLFIEVSDMPEHTQQPVLQAVNLVGTKPFVIPALV